MAELNGKFNPTYELEVKRFYVPGFVLKDNCPVCGQERCIDFSQHYLSYPEANKPFNYTMYCDDCNKEWVVRLILKIGLELAEE